MKNRYKVTATCEVWASNEAEALEKCHQVNEKDIEYEVEPIIDLGKRKFKWDRFLIMIIACTLIAYLIIKL